MANPVTIALFISIGIHLLAVGIWQFSERVPWLKKLPPIRLITAAEDLLLPKVSPPRPAQPQSQPELVFIEVNPHQAVKEAPKDAKFYSAVSTEAANPKPDKNSGAPKIEGIDRTIPKIAENTKSQAKPLQPAPTPETEPDSNENTDEKPKAKQQYPGDLALAKPQEKPGTDHGKNNSEKGQAEQTKRARPLTIAEAKSAGSPGQKSKHEGGVHKIDLSGSVAARGTLVGNYDWELVQAVQQKWDSLLERATVLKPGRVVVEFRLHFDGRVSDVRVAETTVGSLQSLYCEMAIQEPSPYRRWPVEMRRELKGDTRDVRFTFYYE